MTSNPNPITNINNKLILRNITLHKSFYRTNGTNPVARIHSHAAYDPSFGSGNDNFSPTDRANANAQGVDSYMVTPSGILKKYDHKTKTESTISTNMPRDPNHPNLPQQPE